MRRRSIIGLVTSLLFIAAVSAPGTAFAHAGGQTIGHQTIKKHATPDSCYFVNESNNQQKIYVGGIQVGYYDAFVQANTCQNTNRRVGTDVYVTSGNCTSVTMSYSYKINGVSQGGGAPSGSIGPNGCAQGNHLIWFSASQVGNYQ